MPRTRWLVIILLASAGACMPEGNERVPVRGQVRFNGQPLPGGVIAFASDSERGKGNELAVAEIQADGTFHLQGEELGAVSPGWYRVTVAMGQGMYLSLPEKYRDPTRSGLECEILGGHENIIDLDLRQ